MRRQKKFVVFLKKFDFFIGMGYNVVMNTQKRIKTAVIGGGASGLMLAAMLAGERGVTVFERGERLGRKLSATGNGQGNLTNVAVTKTGYFSFSDANKIRRIVGKYDDRSLTEFFESLGLLLAADERGRVYPAGRQASAVTDCLRYALARAGTDIRLQTQIVSAKKTADGFLLTTSTGERHIAENLVLCAGGKAAKNFGTDGNAYEIAAALGHTLTPLYPSLVQLKTDTVHIKSLKGIREANAGLTATWKTGSHTLFGDVIFTDYGVSGDAVFRISAFVIDKLDTGVTLSIDFLPEFTKEKIYAALQSKKDGFPDGEALCGIVNNQVGRAIMKRAQGDLARAASLVKDFSLTAKGSLGFDYAQVTKGGVRLDEVDENLQSKKTHGLYFAGEILDADGQCGGFNLQWAYASARTVADAILQKTRGQV